mmetsp:Transcript_17818/g.29473  ORF Transcript_17818/g.29473 Transcript_17818/m.29473 type:complete len:261 (-) Transcript_17818:827-1609(-)
MEPSAKRARRELQAHDHDSMVENYCGSHPGSHPFLDPYALILIHLPESFLDPEYGVQPWLEQQNLPHQGGYVAYNSPAEATSAVQLHTATNLVHPSPNSREDATTAQDNGEVDGKPTAVTEEDDGRLAALGAAPDVVSSSGFSLKRRSGESQLEPAPHELEGGNNQRSQHALMVWYQRLAELVEFKQAYGNTNVRQKYEPNPPLGIWVNKQRCTRTTLTTENIAALETVGFDWGKRKGKHAWNEKLNELIAYKTEHGDCK